MNRTVGKILVVASLLGPGFQLYAQTKPLSQQMADQVLALSKDSLNKSTGNFRPVKWSYDQGVILEGIDAIWQRTGNGDYFRYMQSCMDFFVTKDGTINTYKLT